MPKKRPPAGTPALTVLAEAAVPHTVLHYDHDPRATSFGLEAAATLGLEPSHVFKTLLADVGDRLTVAVVPVTGQLDLKALARAVGGRRAVMADPSVAERATGYVVGGISPLGHRRPHPTVLDKSAQHLSRIYVSAGRRGLEVGLTPADLARLTAAVWAPIARAR